MKKIYYILLLIALGISANANAQITIRGERPWGVFLIDGAGDDPVTGTITPAQTGNDVFVSASGRVAIGAPPNTTSLRVNGPLTIKDGNQAQDRLLVSDANGKASWKSVGGLPYVVGFIHSTGLASGVFPNSTGKDYYTGNYIELPPGTFAVTLSLLLRTANNQPWAGTSASWIRLTFSDSDTDLTMTNDIQHNGRFFSGSFCVGSLFAIIEGIQIVKNSTSAPKKYYLVTETGSFPSGATAANFLPLPDNKFYAIRLND